MTHKSSALRRLTAAAGAVAIAAVGAISMGSTASAAVSAGPGQPGAPAQGSLTINKLIGSESTDPGDGTEQSVDGTPLENAEFTIWRLGTDVNGTCTALDLTNVEAWNSVPTGTAPATLTEVTEGDLCLTDSGTPRSTAGNGQATFLDLELGLYYVQETDAPANIVSKSAPFYVTIPLPHEGQNWLYDVNVYPKNQELEAPKKTINEDAEQPANGQVVGSEVEWTITQTVPALNDGETYESASVWDVLPDAFLEYTSTTGVYLNGTELTAGTDYTIDSTGVTWKLTEAGLDQLKAGDELKVVFKTTVLAVTATGEIANPGSEGVDPGYGSEFNGGKTPGDTTPYTYWGQLSILKTDDSDPGNTLQGAEFSVADTVNGVCAPEAPEENATIATGISDAEGIVRWAGVNPDDPLGLWIANSSNGQLSDANKNYCVYETKAPAGYVAGQITNPVNIKPGTTETIELVVKNVEKEGPDLPLTGGQGTLLMTLGGLALMIAGAAAVYVMRRRGVEA